MKYNRYREEQNREDEERVKLNPFQLWLLYLYGHILNILFRSLEKLRHGSRSATRL